jgi:hypothetical protein
MMVAAVRGMVVRPKVDKFGGQDILVIKGDVDFAVGLIDFPWGWSKPVILSYQVFNRR